MLDQVDLLEYSTELNPEKKNNELSFSHLNESNSNDTENNKGNINIRDYENIVLKIDNISISEEKTLKLLKDNLLYLECKVPLFKVDNKKDSLTNIFYDTFK